MELFGIALSIGEVLSLIIFIFSAGGAYWKINTKLESILDRNEAADKAHVKLSSEVKTLEGRMEAKIESVKTSLSERQEVSERRQTQQEINYGRVDERLIAISSQLGQALDLLRERIHNEKN